jgi:hypothetical protein
MKTLETCDFCHAWTTSVIKFVDQKKTACASCFEKVMTAAKVVKDDFNEADPYGSEGEDEDAASARTFVIENGLEKKTESEIKTFCKEWRKKNNDIH